MFPFNTDVMPQFAEFRKFVRRDVPLAMYTWFQLGGPAEYFAEPETEAELLALLKQSRKENVPVHVLGVGSNVLAPDEGLPGVVVSLSAPAFGGIELNGNRVVAGGGVRLGRVITRAVTEGLAGIENLIGIPGSVGGAVCSNAASGGDDLGQRVEKVKVATLDGNVIEIPKSEITFGYRSSSLDDVVILSATLKLEPGDPVELSKRMQQLWIVRKSQQPMSGQCSGYVFKNPRTGGSAEELIELAGLKGTRIGGAALNERNPCFVVVEPECTAGDVKRLIQLVQDQVRDRTEIELEPAVDIW